jgi:hypothetical protein
MEQAENSVLQAVFAAWPLPHFCFSCSLALKMEASCFSRTAVVFHQTTRSYIPEVRTIQEFGPSYFALPLLV